ncbi:hypothetical protein JXA63_03350, partial [Candidatus Woesebacteria bacterium]|nr:hypothetical protein [Candidatus Woesebacteria bacterium]
DVDGDTGSITIADGGGAGYISIDSTTLDKDSLDFVAAGTITSTGANDLTLDSGNNTITFAADNTTLTATGLATITSANSLSLNPTSGTDYTLVTSANGTLNIFNTNATTVNAFGAATAVNLGANNVILTLQNGGDLRFDGATSGYIGLTAPATPSSYTLTFPSAVAGTSGQALTSDTSGNLSWATVATGETPWDRTGNNVYLDDNAYVVAIGSSTPFTNSELTVAGTTPSLTIGDADEEDTMLHFDGSAQDYYLGLDDTDDHLKIGVGSTVGTNTSISIDSSRNVGFGKNPALDLTEGATITATGSAQFTSISGAGLVQCSDATDKVLWDSATKKFSCGTNIGEVRSFTDTTTDSLDDTDNTEYWDVEDDNPSIELYDASDKVMVQVSVIVYSGANNQDIGITVRRDNGDTDDADCDDTLVATDLTASGSDIGSYPVISATFIDDPATTDQTAYTICSSDETTGTNGNINRIEMILSEVGIASDYAEVYATNDTNLQIADIATVDPTLNSGIQKTASAYDKGVIGVVSTKPAQVIGGGSDEGTSGVPIAMTGRVPVKVTSLAGPISGGDIIASSYISGYGMRADRSGAIVGKAMHGTDHWNDTYCTTRSSIEDVENYWPYDNGDNSDKPCFKIATENVTGVPSTYTDPYVYVGKIMMHVAPGYHTPKELVNNNANLQIDLGKDVPGSATSSAEKYLLHDGSGNIYENEAAFSDILAANATIGDLTAQQISTATISASLLNLGDMQILETDGVYSILNNLGQSLFSLDSSGNATISGTLTTAGGNYDIAEDYLTEDFSLEPGEIVTTLGMDSGYVARSTKAYDYRAIGIYSSREGFRLSQAEVKPGTKAVPVALAGRVPVKVSASSEPIETGDYLTTSDDPGRAMKAEKAGEMIGKALESWSPESGKDTVMVYVSTSYADPEITLNINGEIDIEKLAIENNDSGELIISGVEGTELATFDQSGNLELSGSLSTEGESIAVEYVTNDKDFIPGDVLAIDPENDGYVIRSTKANDQNVIGIYSVAPGIQLSDTKDSKSISVAVGGKAKVKVNNEGGDIVKGDYLTSSSIEGVAMKATRPGQVLGKALSDFSCSSVSTVSSTGFCTGEITVAVNVAYADPSSTLSEKEEDEFISLSAGQINIPDGMRINGKEVDGSLENIFAAIDTELIATSEKIGILETDVIDLATRSASLEEKVAQIENEADSISAKVSNNLTETQKNAEEVKSLRERLASIADVTSNGLSEMGSTIDKALKLLERDKDRSIEVQQLADKSDLTPFETLLSDDSGHPADIDNLSSANVEELFLARRVAISDSLKVLGISSFGDTKIAGTLSINENLTFTKDSISTEGVLNLQSSPLASHINIFSGAIVLERDGTISTIGNLDVLGNLNIEGAITTTATAGENIKSGSALYISDSQEVKVASATESAKLQVIGLAAEDAEVGRRVTVITGGKVAGLTELETGKKYYLGVGGKITQEIPEDAIKLVSLGVAFSDTELVVQISETSISGWASRPNVIDLESDQLLDEVVDIATFGAILKPTEELDIEY